MNITVPYEVAKALYEEAAQFPVGDTVHINTGIGYAHAVVRETNSKRVSFFLLEIIIIPLFWGELSVSVCDCEKD